MVPQPRHRGELATLQSDAHANDGQNPPVRAERNKKGRNRSERQYTDDSSYECHGCGLCVLRLTISANFICSATMSGSYFRKAFLLLFKSILINQQDQVPMVKCCAAHCWSLPRFVGGVGRARPAWAPPYQWSQYPEAWGRKDHRSRAKSYSLDPRLSGSGLTACATCHNPDFAYGDPRPISISDGGKPGLASTPVAP